MRRSLFVVSTFTLAALGGAPDARAQYPGPGGMITKFHIRPGETVVEGQKLVTLHDIQQTQKMADWRSEIIAKRLLP